MGVEPTCNRVAAGCRAVWLQRLKVSVSSPGVEPGLRPSQSRVQFRHTPEDILRRFQCPTEESNLVWQFRRLPCHPVHLQGVSIQVSRPGLEPGSGPSEGPMRSLAPSRPISVPTWSRTRARAFRSAPCDPLHHRDVLSGADGWTCTSINRFTGPAPSLFGHVGFSSFEARAGFEPRTMALETICSPRSTLLVLPQALRPGAFGVTTTLAALHSSTLR